MRVALVSPYSWTYPGGVTRHIEALAHEFLDSGHDVRVLAPFDPPDKLSARLHGGATPQDRPLGDLVVPLGRTVGVKANGAVSNLAVGPTGVARLRHELKTGGYDVVHLHEPIAPTIGWDALMASDVPMVGTFHCYSTNSFSNNAANLIGARRRLDRLQARIAVSQAAKWTGQRYFGGRYRVIPNGVHVPAEHVAPRAWDGTLRIAFVGQAVERKGLGVLLRAFAALHEHIDTHLTIVGATAREVGPFLLENTRGIEILGRVDDAEKHAVLRNSDLLVAPSLGGESFGMVLTEAFAAGRPVVASDIAGYRDVVRDGSDGVLFDVGDATALAETLRGLALAPDRVRAMAGEAARSAERYAWPRVAEEVMGVYEQAVAVEAPQTPLLRTAWRHGFLPGDGRPRRRAKRLPSIEPNPLPARTRGWALARRAAFVLAMVLGIGFSAIAVQRIGLDSIYGSLVGAAPTWVLGSLALMCVSMVLRAVSWHAILRAVLPEARPRFMDALQGTTIGVLMSAALPARLGEPARAMIVARRLGRPRVYLPKVIGTIVSQALLNILALVILGLIVLQTVDYFDGRGGGLWLFTALPVAVVLAVLVAPGLIRGERFTIVTKMRQALSHVRGGLIVFRQPRNGSIATFTQLAAWGLQLLSCYVLLVALGLDDRAGIGAAAAVLFAVNVSAVLPATPSNVGVFQAACSFVLVKGYGVSTHDALAYGVILQAVEIATAVMMGAPALVKEGLSFKEVRLRALHASPVELVPLTDSASAVDAKR
ncbi:MAG TPA: lysylphosphatidylglycerol synthase domain-containing protein [Baekduia sp.]|nr:lysylphosphatidylglycerol synthase domain-containing protein [Baekduia sp.]